MKPNGGKGGHYTVTPPSASPWCDWFRKMGLSEEKIRKVMDEHYRRGALREAARPDATNLLRVIPQGKP